MDGEQHMSDLREAAEMALDALHNIDQSNNSDAIEALRQALAQPEQEQYVTKVVAVHEDGTYTLERIPLPKREWVGLTEDEVSEIIDKEIGFNSCWGPEYSFARAIEAKLKEKNHG